MLPIYQIFIQDSDELQIALVENPAIEENFLFFNSERKMKFDAYKRIVSGPVLVPNLKIYRNEPTEHYVFYDEETIIKSAQLFFKNGMKFNLQHTTKELPIEIFESYLTKEDNEWLDLPKNTWIVSAKVKSDEVFNNILEGSLKGFSFQGLFSYSDELEYFNKNNPKSMEKETLKEKLLNAINSILFNEEVKEEEVHTEEVTEEVETVEETVETTEEFESVESTDVAAVVEETVDVAENTVEATGLETLTMDEVKGLLETLKEEILMKVSEMITPVATQMEETKTKVEEFSKQPLTESVKVEETVIPTGKTRAERIFAARNKK